MLLHLFLIVATSLAVPVIGDGDPLAVESGLKYHVCSSTSVRRTYLPNSKFQANLAKLFPALPADASANNGFFKGSVGDDAADTVYALALCRGDIDSSTCAACLSTVSLQGVESLCNFSRDVTMYFEECHIRFFDQDFIDGTENEPGSFASNMDNFTEPLFPGWDPGNKENVEFVTSTVLTFLSDTAELAAYRSDRFGTVKMEIGGTFPTLYSMAQCTPDLSPDDCLACLKEIVKLTPQYLSGRQGGRMLGVRCSVRYERDKFYSGDAMKTIGQTHPDTSGSQSIRKNNKPVIIIIIATAVVTLLVLLLGSIIIAIRCIRSHRKGKMGLQEKPAVNSNCLQEETLMRTIEGNVNSDFSLFDFAQLQVATGNFTEENKLGQGGFGPVYKGKLPDGFEIAVKRLSTSSGQGLLEFKNEVELIARLQHANLVRLLGCCSEGEEKMLVYEYLPNKSLDFFIFGKEEKRALLNWRKRITIIEGIAHGLLYLHKHSRLRVIHRDLKASNILLDGNMNPKISDFGIAKIFYSNDIEGNTTRVVGTYGYMAPEYASEGLFSIKSDVFSFGVLLLEIVTGKRTSGFRRNGGFVNLLGYAWKLWKEGKWKELVDPLLVIENSTSEPLKCINVALLCVQENAVDRPTMCDVITMLSTAGANLPEPEHPAYYNVRVENKEALPIDLELYTINEVIITELEGR